jgi:CubicO group peptidase (beta-lactamase class C family)
LWRRLPLNLPPDTPHLIGAATLVALSLGSTSAGCAFQQAFSPADSLERERVAGAVGARLDSLLSAYEREGFSGTVLVAQRGRVLLLKGYGFADKDRRIRNSPATRFELNSHTKMFTATAILQLAGEGKLRLDDRLDRFFGPFPPAKRDATVEHLASHTAGLVVAGANLNGESRNAFIADMKRLPIESTPGGAYRYTNAGYSLLALVVEAASGMDYEAYLRERVFIPAGMRSATFRDAVPGDDTLFAKGYGASPSNAANPYVWGTIGAGGVWSTVGDVYRWVIAVRHGSLIPAAYHRLLHSPPRPPSREAFGWHVYPAADTSRFRIDKGGGSEVFATQLLYYPDDQVVIVWASNDLTRRWRQTLNRALPDIAFATGNE